MEPRAGHIFMSLVARSGSQGRSLSEGKHIGPGAYEKERGGLPKKRERELIGSSPSLCGCPVQGTGARELQCMARPLQKPTGYGACMRPSACPHSARQDTDGKAHLPGQGPRPPLKEREGCPHRPRPLLRRPCSIGAMGFILMMG